jgi:hypothetical protein
MLPSEFPEVSHIQQPSLKRLHRDHLDMQIEDIRVLFRLPTSRLPAGGNFTVATLLLNLIAGASVCFYNASHKTMKNHPPSSQHFKGILQNYYPWSSEPISATQGADLLWKYSRNPLAHALGLDKESAPEIYIAKSRIGPIKIAALEDDPVRPAWASPALSPSGNHYVLDVAGLYWGTHRMLHAVFADPNQLAGAEQLASSLGF